MTLVRRGAFGALFIAITGSAHALVPVTPADIVGTGNMAATCASLHGSGNGLSITDAIDSGLFADATQCGGQLIPGAAATASSGSSSSNALASATTTAAARTGVLGAYSRLDTPGEAAGRFPIAVGQAAFADTLTVNLAGKTGQTGFLLVGIHVAGTLDTSGAAGSAAFVVAAVKDNLTLSSSNPGYDVGTGNTISTDRQWPTWSGASFPVPGPLSTHQVVDETVTFSIPVTFGTSFEMGVIGMSVAGTRSATGGGHSSSDFTDGVTWAGVAGLLVDGAPVQGYTLTSGSGFDWSQAAPVPEPGTWWMLAAGGFVLVGRIRRPAR